MRVLLLSRETHHARLVTLHVGIWMVVVMVVTQTVKPSCSRSHLEATPFVHVYHSLNVKSIPASLKALYTLL
jgi:hypothetical protein